MTGAMVALRGFIGSDGQEWQVWDTRLAKPAPRVDSSDSRSGATDSERVIDFGRVSKKREDGWLTFTAANERARLSPIPDDWESADETALRAYLAAADRIVGTHHDESSAGAPHSA
jgi:hypothetical protein